MPDISMCMNHTCPHRMECYRYRAVPSEYQSYAVWPVPDPSCEDHWPIETTNAPILLMSEIARSLRYEGVEE